MKIRVAVASESEGGLLDRVSKVFGRANTFTLIDLEDGEVTEVKVIKNPGAEYKFGSGPIAVKTLVDNDVKIVMAAKFGPNTSFLLEQKGLKKFQVDEGISVEKAIENYLRKKKRSF
ncbi:hypothetical protein DRN86_02255 [Candidatus Geothermarchaeota archaeon]|nr:MAG: hypothetical protein DRN86_02255 [Candidatus Geothermarchaeota archaeon]